MATRPSSFVNMTLTLVVITIVSALSLGFVYEVTKAPIAEAKLAKKRMAVEAVLPSHTNAPLESVSKLPVAGGDSLEVYQAQQAGQTVGYAISAYSPKGYSGKVYIMVGLDTTGQVVNTYVLDHRETPGLGTKMADAGFKNQFVDINPATFSLKPTKDGGDIDAISGATISSRAFGDAVQQAYDCWQAHLKGGVQ